MKYNLTLKTAPATEPITLTEVKEFLKLSDYGNTCAGLTSTSSIALSARGTGTVTGASVDTIGYTATVELNVGTLTATGKLDVTIQESSDNTNWTTWEAFTQVTTSTDVATFIKQYTGIMRYIRTIGVLTTAGGEYAVNIILDQGYTSEDAYLTSLITSAREYCESFQNRAYITQTWEMSFQEFICDIIELPFGNLQTVDNFEYTNYLGVTNILEEDVDYVVSTRGAKGRIAPAYNKYYPAFTPYPLDAIIIEFTCGYGNAAAVPERTIQAMKILIAHWYTNRIPVENSKDQLKEVAFTLTSLLWIDRLVVL